MQYAPASHGAVVLAVLPLLTAMAGALVAGERPSLGFWACGVAGTGAVLVYSLLSGGGSGDLHWADLLLAASAISAAMAYALGGEMARRIGGWEVISWALVFSSPAMLVLVLLSGPINWAASASAWAGFLYVSVFSMFLGFFAWNKGMAMGGIARIGQIQLLQPFVALAAASALLGESVGWLEIAFARSWSASWRWAGACAWCGPPEPSVAAPMPQFRARNRAKDSPQARSGLGWLRTGETADGEDGACGGRPAGCGARVRTGLRAVGGGRVRRLAEPGERVQHRVLQVRRRACAPRSPRSPTGRRPTTRTPTPPSATGRSSGSSSWRAPRSPAPTSGPARSTTARRQELLGHRHGQEQGYRGPVGMRRRRAVPHRDLDPREVSRSSPRSSTCPLQLRPKADSDGRNASPEWITSDHCCGRPPSRMRDCTQLSGEPFARSRRSMNE